MTWFQPRSALFWVYCVTVSGGLAALALQLLPIVGATVTDILVGIPFALVALLAFGAIILLLDRFRAHRIVIAWLTMGFVWGAAAGPGIAMFANDAVIRVIQNLAGDNFAVNWEAPISASIVEEGVKGAGVFAVAWLARPRLYRPMHGLLLGAFTGLGFQVVEDLVYSANAELLSAQGDVGSALVVGVLRLITGIASHWLLSGIAGIGIVTAATATRRSRRWRAGTFAGFYILAAAMHFGWDAPVTGNAGVLVIGLRGVGYLAIFALVYTWVLGTEKRWFTTTADDVIARGIAPPGELPTLLTRRSRRQARRAMAMPDGVARHHQQRLLDWVQTVAVSPPAR